MATVFSKGQVVKVVAVVPQGPILSFRIDNDGNIFYLVEWVDVDGTTQQRWFKENELTTA